MTLQGGEPIHIDQADWDSIVYDTDSDYFRKEKTGFGIVLVLAIGLIGLAVGYEMAKPTDEKPAGVIIDNDPSMPFGAVE